MSFAERTLTRRQFIELAGGLAASILVVVPLGQKFVEEAKAMGGSSLQPNNKGIDNLSSKPDAGEVKKVQPKAETLIKGAKENITKNSQIQTELKETKSGRELLEGLNLLGKVVYIVYGRPAGGWGTLGSATTAEQTWTLANERKGTISQGVGKSKDLFAYTVINPVYYFDNRSQGAIKDIYVDKALELAPQNSGLVALDFSDIENARKVISEFEGKLSAERLIYLAISLDVEHFLPSGSLEASQINDFCQWFAEKHRRWLGIAKICVPGFVFVYTFGKGKILNIEQLQQYYLPQETMVVPIFDGYGSDGQKLASMANYIRVLPNTEDYPALLGVMEFQTKHGNRYDTVPSRSTFKTLEGAPVFFFASQ